jgi:tetratricopeptide (TPR) repeat protein
VTDSRRKGPNARLAYWFGRSGWNKHELARLVTQRASDLGHRHICTDATRVRRWLGGERPREPIPGILVQLFTERFGHAVTADMLGLDGPENPLSRAGPETSWNRSRTVEALDDFSRSELMLNRRGFLGVGLGASVTGMPSAFQPPQWLAEPERDAPARPGRISVSEVEQIERAIEAYRRWDNEHGGGVHRRAVAAHLSEVCDLLDAPCPEPAARRLFAAAAQLAEIAGWMAHDVGRQATAQKYFTLALQAAKEAADSPLRAEVLSRMARQMIHLGRPGDALDLIQAAQRGAGERVTTTTSCLLYTLEARAYAGLGSVQEVHRAVGRAEEALAGAQPAEDPAWIRYFDAAEAAGCTGDSYRMLSRHDPAQAERAEAAIQRALELRDPQYVRCRALDLAALAATRFAGGEPDHACAAAHESLTLVGRLSSSRVADRLRELRTQAERYSGLPAVSELTQRINGVIAAVPA